MYANEPEKAMSDLEQSSGIMHASKVLYPKNQFPDDEDSGVNVDNQSAHSS